MSQEGRAIREAMLDTQVTERYGQEFVEGTLEGTPVVYSVAGVGKVSAAVIATLLATQFDIDEMVVMGVAGGGEGVAVGDVVVGAYYVQHDLDPRPIFPQYFIHALETQLLTGDPILCQKMVSAAERYIPWGRKVHMGCIASGDQFISDFVEYKKIAMGVRDAVKHPVLAIEMEGAAVAQVCRTLNVPFVAVRAISDKADEQAADQFPAYLENIAGNSLLGILQEYVHEKVNGVALCHESCCKRKHVQG